MNDELLAMLLDILIAQQTAGQQGIGGDLPYDDYGLQGTIGGLGAIDPSRPVDMSDTGIGALTGDPGRLDNSPSTIGYQPPMQLPPGLQWILGPRPAQGWVDVPLPANRPMTPPPPPPPAASGPMLFEDGSMNNPFSNEMDSWRDRVLGPKQAAGVKPASTSKSKATVSRAPQAAQAIATAGRQMSAPAQRAAAPAQTLGTASRRVTTPAPAPTRSTSTFTGNVARSVARSRNR